MPGTSRSDAATASRSAPTSSTSSSAATRRASSRTVHWRWRGIGSSTGSISARAAADGKTWVRWPPSMLSRSPTALTTRPATVRAPATEICWPMTARTAVSNGSRLPGTRRPGAAVIDTASASSVASASSTETGSASRSRRRRTRRTAAPRSRQSASCSRARTWRRDPRSGSGALSSTTPWARGRRNARCSDVPSQCSTPGIARAAKNASSSAAANGSRTGSSRAMTPADADVIALGLRVREPFAAAELLAFFAARAIPGVECWDGTSLHRALRLPRAHGVVELSAPEPDRGSRRHVLARLQLADWRDLGAAVRRVRRLLDLDADPVSVDEALAVSITAAPGLRVPGSVDPFETAVRAVIGQQISVAGARTVAGRVVSAVGERLSIDGGHLTHVFPSAAALAEIDPVLLPMPRQRQCTVRELARRVAADELVLDVGADRDAVAASLLDVPGIGPWTAGYVQMRGLGDPDVFLPTDLGVRVGLGVLGLEPSRAERWRPFRSYGLHHLWSVAGSRSSRLVHGG